MTWSNPKPDKAEEVARKRRMRAAEREWKAQQERMGVRAMPYTGLARPSFLYVIVDERGEVKVGFSVDVEKRRRELQVGRARPLSIYAREAVDCMFPREAEALAHETLKAHRIRGEWFKCHPEVALAAIRKAAWEAEDGS